MKNSATISHRARWRTRVRTAWRKHLRPLWQRLQVPLLGLGWVLALGLGYWGFRQYYSDPEAILPNAIPKNQDVKSRLDIVYLTLQLFTLESGSLYTGFNNNNLQLEVARLLAPLVAAGTALKALAAIFSEQFQYVRLRLLKDHVVICGLGRKGALLVTGFLDRWERVVAIEQDAGNVALQHCREQGGIALVGTAMDRALLRRARVHKAKYLVAVTSDEGANAEVAIHAREMTGDGHGNFLNRLRGLALKLDVRKLTGNHNGNALTCFVHIVDPQLCTLLKRQEFGAENVEAFRLEFFNVFDRGAHALLNKHPAFDEADPAGPPRPHLLIIGVGQLGESLVVQAARRWQAGYTATGERLRITLVDRDADRKQEQLRLRHPRLDKLCELIARPLDIGSLEFEQAAFLSDPDHHRDVTAVYVCVDDDSLGLSAALMLLQRLKGRRVPIVVRMTDDTGLALLLRGTNTSGSDFGYLHAFGLFERTCTPDVLLAGTHEILARAIHEDYRRHQQAAGADRFTNPAIVPWEELPESLKESNRRQANHIGVKLHAVGCEIAPLVDWDAESFQFEPEEVEKMAEMEHKRWMKEREDTGWAYTPGPRDSVRKTSPYLVPWGDLPEEIKEYNRTIIRALPVFLARANFQIERLR